MAKTEPIKHHYIPQFILRSFLGEDGLFYYWDNDNKYLSKRNTKSVFMNNSMYRSEEINPENPVEVENNLSKYGYTDYLDVVSKYVGNGSDWQGDGFYTWGETIFNLSNLICE